MPRHAASKLDPDAREDVSLRLYWSTRKKCWDIIVSGRNGRRSWSCTRFADSTVDIDQAGGWLLAQAVVEEIESWLL